MRRRSQIIVSCNTDYEEEAESDYYITDCEEEEVSDQEDYRWSMNRVSLKPDRTSK